MYLSATPHPKRPSYLNIYSSSREFKECLNSITQSDVLCYVPYMIAGIKRTLRDFQPCCMERVRLRERVKSLKPLCTEKTTEVCGNQCSMPADKTSRVGAYTRNYPPIFHAHSYLALQLSEAHYVDKAFFDSSVQCLAAPLSVLIDKGLQLTSTLFSFMLILSWDQKSVYL